MNSKCPNCFVVNFINAEKCVRCRAVLDTANAGIPQKIPVRTRSENLAFKIVKRVFICVAVCLATVVVFYLSLIFTSKPLADDEKQSVQKAISLLEAKGFEREAFLLTHFTVFRADDNWLNASTLNESAYAATNYPFEIVTIYPGFFDIPQDDTERAMILLHEAQHLKGADEKEAYEFVWKHRAQLGWTKDKYGDSLVWRNVRKQTREFAPALFICDFNEYGDCTK